ncbi:MAG: cupin domain-containing protein [Gemmatimonadetes bacterium]|jgi:quercetin dioxygenase-like cupin family protein|nr:cupin domain-containing protein [Gemmatimonadota bacterium]MBP7549365.1 cupin domain-containing protein [Gemmatimonadaceae bacterium]
MKAFDAHAAALAAVPAHPARPATATVHDAPGLRLVVFRLEPGQSVAPHTSEATVLITVLSGRGTISVGEELVEAGPGHVVTLAPGEPHGMRATADRFCLLATIVRRS